MTFKTWRVRDRARRCRIMAVSATLWCIVVLLPSLSEGAGMLSIEIASGAVLPRGPVLLRDLAGIACDDPELLFTASMAKIDLDDGGVTPEDVTRALYCAGIGGVSVKLVMPDMVDYRLENDIESSIKKTSGWTGTLVAETDRSISSGSEIIPPARLYPGIPSINIRVRERGDETVVPVRLKWLIAAVVSRRHIRRGEAISPSDLAVNRVEFERNRQYFFDPRLLVGMNATRDMAKNQPFTVRTTDEPEVVSSGDRVRIMYKKGGLTVWAPGRAMDGGTIGDVIKVRNQRTRSVVLGTVTGPGTVEVSE